MVTCLLKLNIQKRFCSRVENFIVASSIYLATSRVCNAILLAFMMLLESTYKKILGQPTAHQDKLYLWYWFLTAKMCLLWEGCPEWSFTMMYNDNTQLRAKHLNPGSFVQRASCCSNFSLLFRLLPWMQSTHFSPLARRWKKQILPKYRSIITAARLWWMDNEPERKW